MDDLTLLADWVSPLLQRIEPAGRRKIARKVGIALRKNQQQRIKKQKNIDGSAYAKRRSSRKRGRIKEQAMFKKLRLAKYMKLKTDENKISIRFLGRVAQLAKVHQEGLSAKPSRNSRKVRYTRRELLGFTDADKTLIRDELIDHLNS
jgi:phage virion morphogenesis protein